MRLQINSNRRPFWLPASNYYVLAAAISLAFFFLVWGILYDGGDETPWVSAGISSSMLLCGAVILRELILRRIRIRFLRQQRVIENLSIAANIRSRIHDTGAAGKLTLERNRAILNDIRQKSDAAKLLGKFSAGHREVYELCSEYLLLNEIELPNVSANSPRLAPLLKGRSSVADYRRYHMLKWAEIEARTLTSDAQNRVKTTEKIEAAQNALGVIQLALDQYPSEPSLLESGAVLRDMVVSIKVAHWIEKAERAAFKGNYKRARSLYRDALFDLARDDMQSDLRDQAASRINNEIGRLRALESGDDI